MGGAVGVDAGGVLATRDAGRGSSVCRDHSWAS